MEGKKNKNTGQTKIPDSLNASFVSDLQFITRRYGFSQALL